MNDIIETQEGIFEFASPQTIDTGIWANEHLDCDAIIDNHGDTIVVYAFTLDSKYNRLYSFLSTFRSLSYLLLSSL